MDFEICGDYLCWFYQDHIATMDLTQEKLKISGGDENNWEGVKICLKKYTEGGQSKSGLNISPAPVSTLLSMRTQGIINYSDEEHINRNLMQLTVGDRAFIINLKTNECVYDFPDMHQLYKPHLYVPCVVNIQKNYFCDVNRTLKISQIVTNQEENFFIV